MGGRYLHSDLISEILLHLPAKSLFRFICVCRSWSALVSLPIFIPPTRLLRASVQHYNNFITFDSDGSQFIKPDLDRDDDGTFLCNYRTQKLITFPDIVGTVGFGYVDSTGEFKVLADLSFFGYGYKVLTLGADQWRDVEDPPFDLVGHGCGFVNGNIHIRSKQGNMIASFNLELEEWGSLTAPCNRLSLHQSLKELSGYLCMLDRRFDRNWTMDIWLLKDYDNCFWVKEYTVRISTLMTDEPLMVMPLAIEEGGRLLVQVDKYSLRLYDPKTKSSRQIQRFEELDHTRRFYAKCFPSLGYQSINGS